MFKKIKDIILSDTSKLIDTLEDLGCHDIIPRGDEIRCALPDSLNNTSVRIKKNDFLHVDIFSRHDFEDFEIGDIFALVQYVRKCNLVKAQKYLCSMLDIEYEGKRLNYSKSKSISELKRFKPKKKKEINHTILDESFMEKYEKYVVQEWVKEGIDEDTQGLFEVSINKEYKRWVFPIRDKVGNLICTKGRTYVKDYDLKGIFKYVYYPNLGINNILFGYYLTQSSIKDKEEVVVVEAEKSVMKAWAMGEKNFVASGKAGLNPYQIREIICMKCKRVVLAYDKDIGMDIIQKDIDALKHYKEVYYVLDEEDLLDDKDAPVDQGYWIWLTLYDQKRRGR